MFQLQKYSECILKCIELQQCRRLSVSSNSAVILNTFRASWDKPRPRSVHQGNNGGLNFPVATAAAPFQSRTISTSVPVSGKHNFRKFYLGNKRGDRGFKKRRAENPEQFPDMPIESEVKEVGYSYGKKYRVVPEMIPELVVPDLTDCKLKPYVSYRVADIVQHEFTPQELFSYVYQGKIEEDFKNGKLDADGNPLEPSVEEKLTAEKAYLFARRTGSDIFSERVPKLWECLDEYEVGEYELDTSYYPPVKVKVIKEKDISEGE